MGRSLTEEEREALDGARQGGGVQEMKQEVRATCDESKIPSDCNKWAKPRTRTRAEASARTAGGCDGGNWKLFPEKVTRFNQERQRSPNEMRGR